MVAMPGLGARALESYLRIFIFRKGRDRDIELERYRNSKKRCAFYDIERALSGVRGFRVDLKKVPLF